MHNILCNIIFLKCERFFMVITCGMPWITVSDMKQAKNLFIDLLGGVVYEDNIEYRLLEV